MSRTLLGFDYGRKRIGVASGEELTGSTSPLDTVAVTSSGPDWSHIERLIRDWRPAVLIVGLPMNMDDTEHGMSASARAFAAELETRCDLPVELVDERLSSLAAEEMITEQRRSGRIKKGRAKTAVDQVAASVILQTWLNG